MAKDRPGYWDIWWILSTIFLALAIVFAVLEYLGVLRDLGVILSVVSVGLSIYFGLMSSTRRSARRLEDALEAGFAAEGGKLDRLVEILDERLPRPS